VKGALRWCRSAASATEDRDIAARSARWRLDERVNEKRADAISRLRMGVGAMRLDSVAMSSVGGKKPLRLREPVVQREAMRERTWMAGEAKEPQDGPE